MVYVIKIRESEQLVEHRWDSENSCWIVVYVVTFIVFGTLSILFLNLEKRRQEW